LEVVCKDLEVACKDLEVVCKDLEVACKDLEVVCKDLEVACKDLEVVCKDLEVVFKDSEVVFPVSVGTVGLLVDSGTIKVMDSAMAWVVVAMAVELAHLMVSVGEALATAIRASVVLEPPHMGTVNLESFPTTLLAAMPLVRTDLGATDSAVTGSVGTDSGAMDLAVT